MTVQVVLTSVTSELDKAWREFCGDLPDVEVYAGSILDVPCDAVVSPANSFGFMDGGIDAAYLRHFGSGLERKVRQMISERHAGELVVGCADVVATGDSQIPHLVVAPTMRVPMILKNSVNPYLAARAALRLVGNGGLPVERIAFPGLGTGVGQVSPSVCAKQMAEAISHVLLNQFTPPDSWAEASERHQLLYGSTVRRLQHDAPT